MAEDPITENLLEKLNLLSSKPGENSELLRALSSKLFARVNSQDPVLRQTTFERLLKDNSVEILSLITLLERNASNLMNRVNLRAKSEKKSKSKKIDGINIFPLTSKDRIITRILAEPQNSRDVSTCINISGIIREIICLKSAKAQRKLNAKKSSNENCNDQDQEISLPVSSNSKKNTAPLMEQSSKELIARKANNTARMTAVCQLVKFNTVSIVTRILLQIQCRKEPNNASMELILNDVLWILSQLTQKDQKFALRFRMMGGLKVTHGLLRVHFNNNKILFPLLNIIKHLAKNSSTCGVLVRDGIIATYEKVLGFLGLMPTARLKLCLNAIDYFSRNKICCIQIMKNGIMSNILRIFDRWDKYDGKIRLRVCAHILQTLQHICNYKTGRRTLSGKKNILLLQRFYTSCPDDESYDRLVAKVCSIICLCLNNKNLPVSIESPASFDLSFITNEECFVEEDNDNIDSSSDEEDEAYLLKEYNDQHGSDSECLQDDFMCQKSCIDSTGISSTSFTLQTSLREPDELKRYNPFFKEFAILQKQLKLIKNRSNSKGSLNDISNSTLSDFDMSKIDHSTMLSTQTINLKLKVLDQSGYMSTTSLKILKDLKSQQLAEQVYISIASRVRSVIPFVKVAYPDLYGGQAHGKFEYLNESENASSRKKLINCVEKAINAELPIEDVVYDIDALCLEESLKPDLRSERIFTNNDAQKIINRHYLYKKVEFESRFESGNLRKAIQTGPREFDLILMPDVNSLKRHLWFYFEIRNMCSGSSYIFNIVNCEKSDSQFNFGMKPVLYSVREASLGRPGWVRAGSDICYYRNTYQCPSKLKNLAKCYLTVTFTIEFPHSNDVCYLAYHYPYTYSQMMAKIWMMSQNLPPEVHFRLDNLANSLNNNEIPLVTITAEETSGNPIHEREIIFLTSRVHPGESNASWVMEGTLSTLLGNTPASHKLRSKYVFKIVPMLNVEGVINGCYRCGLTNEDLNRRWSKPSPSLHPDIFHTKGLLEYMSVCLRKPATVYCDFHGHSRKKNVFLYGCAPSESWCPRDRQKATLEDRMQYMALPVLMQQKCGAFSLDACSFRVERERESTARVTVWRQLAIARSYTLEASFCGFDQGPFKGLLLNTRHLRDVGRDLCSALAALGDPNCVISLPDPPAAISTGRKKQSDSDGSSGDSFFLSDSEEDDS